MQGLQGAAAKNRRSVFVLDKVATCREGTRAILMDLDPFLSHGCHCESYLWQISKPASVTPSNNWRRRFHWEGDFITSCAGVMDLLHIYQGYKSPPSRCKALTLAFPIFIDALYHVIVVNLVMYIILRTPSVVDNNSLLFSLFLYFIFVIYTGMYCAHINNSSDL